MAITKLINSFRYQFRYLHVLPSGNKRWQWTIPYNSPISSTIFTAIILHAPSGISQPCLIAKGYMSHRHPHHISHEIPVSDGKCPILQSKPMVQISPKTPQKKPFKKNLYPISLHQLVDSPWFPAFGGPVIIFGQTGASLCSKRASLGMVGLGASGQPLVI